MISINTLNFIFMEVFFFYVILQEEPLNDNSDFKLLEYLIN